MLDALNFSEANSFVHLNFPSAENLLHFLANHLNNAKFVTEDFYPALLAREKQYPTGLETPIPISLPHVGEGIRQPFLAIATLEEPVLFKDMGGSNRDIPVRIVILFGNNSSDAQAGILQKLSGIIQDEEKLKELLESPSATALYESFKNMIG